MATLAGAASRAELRLSVVRLLFCALILLRFVWIHVSRDVPGALERELVVVPVPMMESLPSRMRMASLPPSVESDEAIRDVADAAPNGVVIVDPAGTIALVNQELERMFGYPRANMIGRAIEMLIPDRLRDAHQAGPVGLSRRRSARSNARTTLVQFTSVGTG